MADTKISALTALTVLDDLDEFVVVDKSDTSMAASGTDKRITAASLLNTGLFSAYRSSGGNAATNGSRVTFNTEEFDLSSWYDTATGLYTPQIAGYYELKASVMSDTAPSTLTDYMTFGFDKNASVFKSCSMVCGDTSAAPRNSGSCIVLANGSTDAFGVLIITTLGSGAITSGAANTFFQGRFIGPS